MFPPCEKQFHQHFVTSNNASRYVATGRRQHPLPAHRVATRARRSEKTGRSRPSSRSVKEGGDQIEYEDQDPRIHQIWLEEMRKRGITPKLELPVR